ncbi:hypothetical protein CYLTODRAFT_487283 [Cylindrobasidium torrendii FP15055 ss-10]|uniref:Uncharacterized protein n=1 Tax=Cylindrobasidium torrendii FP15055 ss-10 TaxID=1314674 RepID=A0A0D7BMD3_9AGAR|nr:hypothetical protein CYLTODRAFT_487283 [Cylindrobasidium torrendii FP15055 ss-10]
MSNTPMLGLGRLRLLTSFTNRLRRPTSAKGPAETEEVQATHGDGNSKDVAEDALSLDHTEHTSLDDHTSEAEHEESDEFEEIPTNSDEIRALEDMEEFINTPTDPVDPNSSPVRGTRSPWNRGRSESHVKSPLALSSAPNSPSDSESVNSPARRLAVLKRSREDVEAADESPKRDSKEARAFKKTRMGHLNRVPTMAERLEELLKSGRVGNSPQSSGPATPAAQKGVRHLRQHQQDYGSSPFGSSSGSGSHMPKEADEDDEFEISLQRPIFNRLEDDDGVESWD